MVGTMYRVQRTQTIQTARMPFMSRFLCVIARILGIPPFFLEGGGSFRTLKESYVFKNRVQTLSTGITSGMMNR